MTYGLVPTQSTEAGVPYNKTIYEDATTWTVNYGGSNYSSSTSNEAILDTSSSFLNLTEPEFEAWAASMASNPAISCTDGICYFNSGSMCTPELMI